MKIIIQEHERAFSISLKAENQEDAGRLTRMGLNLKKEVPFYSFHASRDGDFTGYISMQKKKEGKSLIK